jgi:hypothetical protein
VNELMSGWAAVRSKPEPGGSCALSQRETMPQTNEASAMMTVEGSIDSVLLSDCNLSPYGCAPTH